MRDDATAGPPAPRNGATSGPDAHPPDDDSPPSVPAGGEIGAGDENRSTPAANRAAERPIAATAAAASDPPARPGHDARPPGLPSLRRILQSVQDQGRRAGRDRRRAGLLLGVLRLAGPAQRAELIAGDSRFASRALAERLLAAAGAAARNRPAAARELTDLALAVIARLDAERAGATALVALRVAAHARRAEALWWGKDYRQAEAVLEAALDDVDATPLGSLERGLYCRVAALVRAGQGRCDEALGLLSRAAQIYRDRQEQADLAACLVERGWLLADHDPRAAQPPLREALRLSPGEAAYPWAAVRARLGLALCLSELGQLAEAGHLLRQARALASALEEEGDRLRCAWTEAQIEARLGHGDRAMAALAPVVEGWLGREEGYFAALAGLDLAELYLDHARWQGLAELEQLHPRLRGAGLASEAALAVQAVLSLAAREPAVAPFPLEHLRAYLWRARHRPELAYTACRTAARVVRWDELPIDERRQICERAGVAPMAPLPAAAVIHDLRQLIAWTHQEATGVRIEWDGFDDQRARLRLAAEALRSAQTHLQETAASISLPSNHELDEILTAKRPPSEALLLSGAVDHTIAAYLEPAIRDLQDAADGRSLGREAPGS